MLSSILPLQVDEEDISYDVQSLLTNISIEETFNYIIEQIYVHKKLTLIRWKLAFKRLLIKLDTECSLKFNSRFFKQVHDCTMVAPLPVTFSDMYIVKIEYDVVIPSNPLPMIYR